MDTIECIFCGPNTPPDPVAIRENGYEGRQCRRCQLVYVSPRPSVDEVINLYAHDEAKTGSALLQRSEYGRRLAAKHALRILYPRKKAGSLLEIGAGMGFFCDEARFFGYVPYAIELNPIQAEHCTSLGIPTDLRTLAEAHPGKKFDIIYHCDVLSHFTDPIAEFRIMVSRLNPGGVICFETGNYGDVDSAFYPLIPCFQYPDHLFFFSKASLHLLLERSGLKIVKISRYGRLAEMMIQKALNRRGESLRNGDCMDIKSGTKMKQWVRHWLLYKIGALHPLPSAPQTLIVVGTRANQYEE